MKLEADTNDVFFFDDTIQRRRHLPQLRIAQSAKKIRKTGIAFGYEATAEKLAQGNDVQLQKYSRIDAAPELSRPLSLPFIQVTPKALVRYTRYGSSLDESGVLDGPALDRKFFEGSVEMRGPKLFRVFNVPGGFYSEKAKHAIEPEIYYTYRSPVKAFNNIPSFDFNDQYPGTNQVLYGLTQRLFVKRPAMTGGKLTTLELFNWRIAQTYYFDIGANQFDPNYYSALFARGPGGAASHYSPVQSRMTLRPSVNSSLTYSTEYNPSFHQFSSLSAGSRLRPEPCSRRPPSAASTCRNPTDRAVRSGRTCAPRNPRDR